MLRETIPVVPDLFEISGSETRLIGSRCAGCGTRYFPQAPGCRNPACADKRIERVLLEEEGKLYSYTVQAYRPPPLFRMDEWVPYPIGVIEFEDGLRVMGMMVECAVDQLHIGMAIRFGSAPLYTDDAGRTVTTYAFLPAAATDVEARV